MLKRMALPFLQHVMSALGELRFAPLTTRLRAEVDGHTVLDSTHALLVWEPRRIVPSYAVPVDDLDAELVEATDAAATTDPGPPVLHPGIAFGAHSTPGTPFDVRTGDGTVLAAAAFRPNDADLSHAAVLDFHAFDRWLEEAAESVGHPRDPLHRVDVRPAGRHVEVRLDGETLASSDHAYVLTETHLPNRFYFSREDVRMDLLAPSDHRTTCAYKGHASHWSVPGRPEGDSIAWTYEEPLHDAEAAAGAIAFSNERVEVLVDGEPEAPATEWSKARWGRPPQ